jgi:hypothetical protein
LSDRDKCTGWYHDAEGCSFLHSWQSSWWTWLSQKQLGQQDTSSAGIAVKFIMQVSWLHIILSLELFSWCVWSCTVIHSWGWFWQIIALLAQFHPRLLYWEELSSSWEVHELLQPSSRAPE